MGNKAILIEHAQSLGIDTKGLTVAQLEEAIAAKEAELAEANKNAEEEVQGFKLKDGRVFGLSKRTPKTLKVLNTVYTQEELLQSKEAMEFLIVGNSGFVIQLK